MHRWIPLLLAFLSSAAFAQATVSGPANAKAGAAIQVTVTGSKNLRDFVTIVEKSSREGAYGGYEYVSKPGAFKLMAPAKAGEYEIRLLAADSPYPTLARRPLRIDAVEATLDACQGRWLPARSSPSSGPDPTTSATTLHTATLRVRTSVTSTRRPEVRSS